MVQSFRAPTTGIHQNPLLALVRSLKPAMAFSLAAAALVLSTAAPARDLTVVSWGGAYQDAQREVYFKPFMEKTKTKLAEENWDGGVGTLRAEVQGGNNNWDVVQVESEELLLGCEEEVVAAGVGAVVDVVAGVPQTEDDDVAVAPDEERGRGDAADLVIQVFKARSGSVQVVGVVELTQRSETGGVHGANRAQVRGSDHRARWSAEVRKCGSKEK